VDARGAKGGKRNAEMIGATAVAAYSKCLMVFGNSTVQPGTTNIF